MSKTGFKDGLRTDLAADFQSYPQWPTTMREMLDDGRCLGSDPSGKNRLASVWLYRVVPLSPVLDVREPSDALDAAGPLYEAFRELEDLTPVRMRSRRVARQNYRQIHLLLINVPQLFQPEPDHPLREQLLAWYGDQVVPRRLLLMGVQLLPRVNLRQGGLRALQESVTQLIVSGDAPLDDYDLDFQVVDAALSRAGLSTPSAGDIRLANSWWTHGRYADVPWLQHADHIHFFDTVDAVYRAEGQGLKDCSTWTPKTVPNEAAVTFAAVSDLELQFADATAPTSAWMTTLLQMDALAVSVRGHLEPAKITGEEVRRQRSRIRNDIRERDAQGKMQRFSQDEELAMLAQVEQLYQAESAAPPPTLHNTSILAALNGVIPDIRQAMAGVRPKPAFDMAVMAHRQRAAMAETMLCSPARANPHLLDLPVSTIAFSGLPALSFGGDDHGALLGFSERDGQPIYISPDASSRIDSEPMFLGVGGVGSGKTMTMQWLAYQFAKIPTAKGERTPVVMINPKDGSDLSPVVIAAGGQHYDLDDLLAGDGAFDPIRFSSSPSVGADLAVSMLSTINPWGPQLPRYETDLSRAIAHGVSKGARCVGQALQIAEKELDDLPSHMIEEVWKVANSNLFARAMIGMDPDKPGLRVSEGLTLIQVGQNSIPLPEPNVDPSTMKLSNRVGMALLKMMVFGSGQAVAYRQGVVMFDEAWVFLSVKAELERLGRLARSQDFLVMMWTQRVVDAARAELQSFISRGLILSNSDPEEAYAACDLFKLDASDSRIGRITAKPLRGKRQTGSVVSQNPSFNPASLRALIDPHTRVVHRPAVGINVDLAGTPIATLMTIPSDVLELASSNPEDIRRRLARVQTASPTALI